MLTVLTGGRLGGAGVRHAEEREDTGLPASAASTEMTAEHRPSPRVQPPSSTDLHSAGQRSDQHRKTGDLYIDCRLVFTWLTTPVKQFINIAMAGKNQVGC